jgi:Putative DNA-binding domain
MSRDVAAIQTALLELLHADTINSIALCADFIPATCHFSFKNPAKTERGLRAYRANAQEISHSALQASYPVMQQLLGEENFRHLAQDMWLAHPPQRGDLAQWGGQLAAYLREVPQLQGLLGEHPYLPDIAQVEWALHKAATATDAALDAESFQLMTSTDPSRLQLVLCPGCVVQRSKYPVVSIMQLHDERASDAHTAARQAVVKGEAQTALVWRQGFRPRLMQLDTPSATLIEATLQGDSLAAALDAALAQAADFDFSVWLSVSVQSGLLIAARQL